jgi:hypothetical protein
MTVWILAHDCQVLCLDLPYNFITILAGNLMPEPKRPLKVFLCHASADKPKVRDLYRYLRRRGIKPWFDEIELVGGQDWQVEIPKALATSDAIIICLTKNSVDKEGYIQKEIKFALDKALEMPEGRIFLIPVRFEECEVPFSLSRYQWVDLLDEAGYARMMKALKFRAAQLQRSTVELPLKDIEGEKLALEKATYEKQKRKAVEKVELESAEKATREAESEVSEKTTRHNEEQDVVERIAQNKTLNPSAFEPININSNSVIKASEINNRELPPSDEVEKRTQKPVAEAAKSEIKGRRRKWNMAVIVSLIGLIGICIALGISPILSSLFSQVYKPAINMTQDPNARFTAAALTVKAMSTIQSPSTPTLPPPPATNTAVSFPTSVVVAPPTAVCDLAQFVRDVSIPDGSVFAPGDVFTKTWRFKNVGTCTWSGYSLVFDSGDSMNGASPSAIKPIAPGQEFDLSVTLTAPATPGNYRGYWRIRNASGVLIPVLGGTQGKSFFLAIKVTNPTSAP